MLHSYPATYSLYPTRCAGYIYCYLCFKTSWRHLVATTAVLWKMMYRIKDWFIHLLILNTVYEHDKHKTIVY